MVTSSIGHSVMGSGTQNMCLRDACCLAIASLTTHPSADKRLAGHLPALLSGLLGLCDECSSVSQPSVAFAEHSQPTISSGATSPPEEAAIAVQKVITVVVCHIFYLYLVFKLWQFHASSVIQLQVFHFVFFS